MIAAHVLVKNEDRFIWYSLMSVLRYVDKIYIWDMGSTDRTLETIEEVKKNEEAKGKIFFKQLSPQDKFEEARQGMLENTDADWFIVVDGDEIWWENSIKKIIKTIKKEGKNLDSIVVPTFNLVGDIFHYQEKEAGRYSIAGKVGHYNLRAINRKIPGLKAKGEHGIFGWVDLKGRLIEKRNPSRIYFLEAPYLHATHLRRSNKQQGDELVYKRKKKLKYETGISFPKDFYYPEVFFRPRPAIVPLPWEIPGISYKIRALIETPFKKLRRRYFMWGVKPGY
jgi:hypothetical protein